ncbi:hypothetical protein J1N35_041220 [Gossypium stocksii]|uniref:Uncharacterized protein n=1 Tax=Gossypium stocksii TaxID=47602 RepID=A0A9D3ZJ29_9ROSI|nr:hypothetical protein J1N35_041220 [Gossypium stocksii]
MLPIIGTDIEDFKCFWLVVKALEICNEEQKKVLYENYGKPEPANVAKVKALFFRSYFQVWNVTSLHRFFPFWSAMCLFYFFFKNLKLNYNFYDSKSTILP